MNNIAQVKIQYLNTKIKLEEVKKYILKTFLLNAEQKLIIDYCLKNVRVDVSELSVVLFAPANVCGACLISVCDIMLDEGLSKKNIAVITEQQNEYLRKQLLGLGISNVMINNDLFTNILLNDILIVFRITSEHYYVYYDNAIDDLLTNICRFYLKSTHPF